MGREQCVTVGHIVEIEAVCVRVRVCMRVCVRVCRRVVGSLPSCQRAVASGPSPNPPIVWPHSHFLFPMSFDFFL